jgi:hypothetical protein
MLKAAFFERGWLEPNFVRINPMNVIALKDIDYVTRNGNFIVVDNTHQYLQGECALGMRI